MSDNTPIVTLNGNRIGFFGIFFLILFLLKVGVGETVVVGWSWWWITSPLWGPIGIIIIVPIVVLFLVAVMSLVVCLFVSISSLISQAWKKMRK